MIEQAPANRPISRGRFISLEGGEGTGKSTQSRLLAERLRARGIAVTLTREPGGSPGAEALRHVLLSGAAKPFGAETEALLFAAAREDHARSTIVPALARGEWVVCDRFADSTRVYQGLMGKVEVGFLDQLQQATIGQLEPDLTLILDLPAQTGLQRAGERRGAAAADRFESEDAAFHERLRQGFLEIARLAPQRCVVIDAAGAVDEVAEAVWTAVSERLGPWMPQGEGLAPVTAGTKL